MADYPAHYKFMASQGGASVNQPYMPSTSMAPPAPPSRFQELPRLQVPSFALQQQQPQPWKASPVLAPQPQPSRMSVSNILSFRRSSSSVPVLSAVAAPPSPPPAPAPAPPTRRLPSFQEILARTNLLNIISRSNDEPAPVAETVEEDEEQMAVDVEPVVALAVNSGDYGYYQQQAQYAPQQYAPAIDVNVAMETTSNAGNDVAQAVPSSPVSQTSESNKRRERWTEEEHALFMEGLNRYGRKWKKIQTYVKTKTAVQVRTHAYGYFAKLLRNMPEDDAIWELAEEMSSLPGAVLKGPGNGKRRNEPKTDEQGMEVLRRFVFSKKKTDDAKKALANSADNTMEDGDNVDMVDDSAASVNAPSDDRPLGQPTLPEAPAPRRRGWPFWGVVDSSASSTAEMELKRQRLS